MQTNRHTLITLIQIRTTACIQTGMHADRQSKQTDIHSFRYAGTTACIQTCTHHRMHTNMQAPP